MKVSVIEGNNVVLIVDVPGMVGPNIGTALHYNRGDTLTVEFPEVLRV